MVGALDWKKIIEQIFGVLCFNSNSDHRGLAIRYREKSSEDAGLILLMAQMSGIGIVKHLVLP